jgi:hypothetical protein
MVFITEPTNQPNSNLIGNQEAGRSGSRLTEDGIEVGFEIEYREVVKRKVYDYCGARFLMLCHMHIRQSREY